MDALWEMEAVGEDTERVVAKIECERLDLVTDYTTWHLRALSLGRGWGHSLPYGGAAPPQPGSPPRKGGCDMCFLLHTRVLWANAV